ncbi:MAG: chromosome segregation protein SMC [Bifidobacteriaceae bacterium]|jgi:chromosome segregation protein|nr:chromosome segregation protein SMC [Bifidobacteriaceae bacterium]
MYLKTLTLRGFKSFASATRLSFEPGITCVVGPNGSGKSNVVDALAWVMGEQGAKSLRGGKMEDVIFAGTRTRPALGRAEVRLTIDNTDGALPIDYTEVTISRTLFRNGGSEYAINGTPCRLLDIQELLSDSGMGREMHVIVGQGHLDDVLTASPEERRGFIEEAAGVLKHRKRKERALRKLDAMQANLTRLQDLTGEIRRQLGPLAKQADVARRAQGIQAAVRDAMARLLADDAAQLTAQLAAELADETALNDRRDQLQTELAVARADLAKLEAAAAAAAPELSKASDLYFRASSLAERVRATRALAGERARLLGSGEFRLPEAGVTGAGSAEGLEALADRLEAEAAQVADAQAVAQDQAEAAETALTQAVAAAQEEERRYTAALRAQADRREGLAALTAKTTAARAALDRRAAEIAELAAALEQAQALRHQAETEFTALEQQIAGVEDSEESLDAAYERAGEALAHEKAVAEALQAEQQQGRTDLAGATATLEALDLALTSKDGTLPLQQRGHTLGPVAAMITVEPGFERAIAAALGQAAAAVAVESPEAAVDALRLMRADGLGQAGLVISQAVPDGAPSPNAAAVAKGLPAAARPALTVVTLKSEAAGAIGQRLAPVVVVETLAQAKAVLASHPELVAVTTEGDLLSRTWAHGGGEAAQSMIELQAAKAAAEQAVDQAKAVVERTTFELVTAEQRVAEAEQRVAEAYEQLAASDARYSAVAETLGRLSATVGRQKETIASTEQRLAQAEHAREQEVAELAALEQALESAQAGEEPSDQPIDATAREQAAAAAEAARQAHLEAGLEARALSERLHALTDRAKATRRAAEAEQAAAARAEARAALRARQSAVARAVEQAAAQLEQLASTATSQARDQREKVEQARAEREAALAGLRGEIDQFRAELTDLTDAAHREEMARTAQRMRLEALADKAMEDLGLTLETLAAEYGPDQPVPAPEGSLPAEGPNEDDPDAPPPTIPYVREEQEKRLRRAQRELSALGRVNPLALEEYQALEQRHRFLQDQLADLKKSRADLLEVIKEIDGKVEQVFADAYLDTEKAFTEVFARLFPGGEGKLIATEPGAWLTTGVDIEARPAGKSVKRLSLLSGGERSLVAVAFTLAIFMARPSPFYVMDEVEAALDDTNLGRLLAIVEELRDKSQILLVTHQKRTMEIGDALYGVTMQNDGVSTVISQRLRDV